MKPFIRKKLPLILIAVQAVLILGILFYIVPGRYRLYDIVLYDASENVPSNPLIGYAPRAENREDCEGTDLVFIMLPFSEWEPQEGQFDTAGVEKKYHLREYMAAGKHAVVRFVCDQPGKEAHRDIPDWLYQKTGDGLEYKDAEGRGYTPDYTNSVFRDAHKEALAALADWCGSSSFTAYVEIGSIGRNGDWSSWADDAKTLVPSRDILAEYARQYQEAFADYKDICLLGSTDQDLLQDCGSWRDCLGDREACARWDAQTGAVTSESQEAASGEAGTQETTSVRTSSEAVKPDTEKNEDSGDESDLTGPVWTRQPVGGGMTSTIPMSEILMESLSDTLEQIRNAHVSFIGPSCPDKDQQKTNGSGMILRSVGYCIYLSRLQTTVDYIDDSLLFHLTFSNIGLAPMYRDWPVKMYVYDNMKNLISEQTLDLSLSQLLPGTELTVTGSVPYSKELLKGYSVGIAITDPEGKRHIRLAQKGVIPNKEGIHKVYRYRGR